MKSRSFPRYRDQVYIPPRFRPRPPISVRVLNFLFWASVLATPLTLWVWVSWMFNLLEVAR